MSSYDTQYWIYRSELSPDQLNIISRTLTEIYKKKELLFKQSDPLINKWVSNLWSKIVAGEKLDPTLYDKSSRMIAADSIEHKQVREVGTEWMCYNTWQELGIDQVLEENDFSELEKQLAQTQVISRAVHPASELATSRWIKENSAISELTGFPLDKMNKDRLYKSALKLYGIKDKRKKRKKI